MARLSVTAAPYVMFTKPGIIMGNAVTMTAGFVLASRGDFQFPLFLATLIGLSLIIASACVFNNYIDRHIDQKMNRTKNRIRLLELITSRRALFYGTLLGLLGAATLAFFTNVLALSIALLGFVVYVVLYTYLKPKTVHGTLIGSIAGAVPPVVGYTAASGRFDLGALLFFALVALWQIPHFLSIAIYRIDDYAAASIPVLPIKRGMQTTKIHMLVYIIAFTVVASLLTVYGYTGSLFLLIASAVSLVWLALCIKGFKASSDKLWARQMFIFSLVVIMTLSFAIVL